MLSYANNESPKDISVPLTVNKQSTTPSPLSNDTTGSSAKSVASVFDNQGLALSLAEMVTRQILQMPNLPGEGGLKIAGVDWGVDNNDNDEENDVDVDNYKDEEEDKHTCKTPCEEDKNWEELGKRQGHFVRIRIHLGYGGKQGKKWAGTKGILVSQDVTKKLCDNNAHKYQKKLPHGNF